MKRTAPIKAKSPAPVERADIWCACTSEVGARSSRQMRFVGAYLRGSGAKKLAALTDDDTRRLVAALPDPVFTRNAHVDPWRVSNSGFVEQPRIFMKLRA